MSFSGKRILLGVSGGIAAYKAAELTRRLVAAGAWVKVAMTKSAQEFVTPLTFEALTGQPVAAHLFGPQSRPLTRGSGCRGRHLEPGPRDRPAGPAGGLGPRPGPWP